MNSLLHSINQTDLISLSQHPKFTTAVYVKVCQVNQNLILKINNTPTNCNNVAYYLQQLLINNGNNMNQINQNAIDEKNEILFIIKCDTGEIDKTTCNNYVKQVVSRYQNIQTTNQNNNMMMQMQMDMMNQSHKTNMGIIDNMAGCPSGYYMQDGNCYPQ